MRLGPRAPWRLRSVLLAGLAVPVLAIAVIGAVFILQGRSQQAVSVELEQAAADVGLSVELSTAVAAEQIYSSVVALATEVGIDPDSVIDPDKLEEARDEVDAFVDSDPPGDVRVDLADVIELRSRIDASASDFAEVDEVFSQVNEDLLGVRNSLVEEVQEISNKRPLSADLRARLRTLQESSAVFRTANARISDTIGILIGPGGRAQVQELIETTSRFDSAAERLEPTHGSRADAAWQGFLEDGAAQRTENVIDLAIEVGNGEAETPLTDLDALAPAIEDGARWSLLLSSVVGAAGHDLEEFAADQAHRDSISMLLTLLGVAAVVLVSSLAVLRTARKIGAPTADLEQAARRIADGEFDLPPIEPRGPRELAATVGAFNEMAATLAGVENQAVALAEDLDSEHLSEPLPGGIGRAMQKAFDRLHESIRVAALHRDELTIMATRDRLTGLLNRGAALDALGRDLSRAERHGRSLAVLFLDLDGLKFLNDEHGHDVGDAAIRRTADVLRKQTRDGDVVSRLGGDEFLVATLVDRDGEETIEQLAERIRLGVANEAVEVEDGPPVGLRVSVGVAQSMRGTKSVDELVKAADSALYRAKRGGRNRISW